MARLISQLEYHRTQMAEASHQFDLVETTLSHLFRFPHPALEGRSFGEALADQLLSERASPRMVVEVGGGTGSLAASVQRRLADRGQAPAMYTVVDVAPPLQRAQRERLTDPSFRFVTASAGALPLRTASVDGWLLSNEVIADLDVVEYRLEPGPADDALDRSTRALAEHHGLRVEADGEGVGRLNLGAILFLEEIARVLAPGSLAYLSEFGGTEPIRTVDLSDLQGEHAHNEFSIRFDHLRQIAERLALDTSLRPMVDYLRFDRAQRVCNYPDALLARFFRPSMSVFAYTPEQLSEQMGPSWETLGFRLPAIGGADFPDNQSRPFAESFLCLTVRKR